MKRIMIIAAIAALSGCANLNNMTPDEREAYVDRWRAASAAQQQATSNALLQEQQALQNASRNAQAGQGTNCTTSYVGNQAYTHCN
jgi:hypothetical protein